MYSAVLGFILNSGTNSAQWQLVGRSESQSSVTGRNGKFVLLCVTVQSRVLLETLTFPLLVLKVLSSYETGWFIAVCTTARHLSLL